MPTVQTQDIPSPVPVTQAIMLEGNVTFKVYPDENIKMNVAGSIERATGAYLASPLYYFSLNLSSSPAGANLTENKGIIVMKLSPIFSPLLAALDFDIETHGEDLRSNTTILFNMPGYLRVNGTLGAVGDESTGESTQDFALTATIWYSIFPEELIQEYVQMFPMFKSLIETQLSELTEGNITLQELTLVTGEMDYTSATLTITGSLVGDFTKGMMALTANYMELLGIDDTQTMPWISPEELMIKTKSIDFHIRFDRNELAFIMDSENIIEGDLDKLINIMQDASLEQILQSPYITPELALMINNILIPTEISTENLNVALEYSFDGEKLKLDFAVEGLGFRPPTTEAFLTILDKAFTGASLPGFSLVLEGGSDEKEYVEIVVLQPTSAPVVLGHRKVVWIVDNLENLSLVYFKVTEWPTLTLTVSQTEVVEGDTVDIEGLLSLEGESCDGQEIDIAVNDMVIGTVKTAEEGGGFSFTYTFVDAGSYEVKSSSDYYEKTIESPITIVTVKSPPLLPSGLVAPVTGIAIAVAVVGYIFIKRR